MSRWPSRKAYFWQTAPFFRLLLPLVAGIILYDFNYLLHHNNSLVSGVLLLSGLALLLLGFYQKRLPWLNAAFTTTLFVFFTAAGFCLCLVDNPVSKRDFVGQHPDTNSLDLVRIIDAPREGKATMRYEVEMQRRVGEHELPISGKALMYVYKKHAGPVFQKGDLVMVPEKWQPIQNNGNPFEFDNKTFQRRNHVYLLQFLAPDDLVTFSSGNNKPGFIDRAHNWSDKQLQQFVRDTITLGLLRAMLLGDESGFDPELRQAYSQTGVVHIVSISGSHVGMLFLVVSSLLFWIKGRRGAWIKYSLGLILVWLYVLVAGAPPSAVRSAGMFTIIALSILSEREGQSLNTLLGAAFIILVGKPEWLFSLGFQLSFAAVLSILIFYKPIYQLWPQQNKIARFFWQAAAVSFAAELFTAPIVIYYFHNFPLFFLFANLLSAILVGFCALVGGMAIIALCWIPPLAGFLGIVVTELVHLFNTGIFKLQKFNPQSFQFLKINGPELALIYCSISALAVWWLLKYKRGLLIALTSLAILMMLMVRDQHAALKQNRLVVYNNGKQANIEFIKGNLFTPLCTRDSNNYNCRAAHTGWHAWRENMIENPEMYFRFAGQNFLIIRDSVNNFYQSPLPVDILILARPLSQIRVGNWLQTFHPKEVVLAVRPSAYHLRRWKDSCTAHNVRLFSVAQDGAYVLD